MGERERFDQRCGEKVYNCAKRREDDNPKNGRRFGTLFVPIFLALPKSPRPMSP